MLIGNAAAPRWYELDPARLDQYVAFLVGMGARTAELVLHHGPMDRRGARVHILEPDWRAVAGTMQSAGIACQLHASLDPRFALSRWKDEREQLKSEYLPLLAASAEIAERQGSPAAFVIHATSSADARSGHATENAIGFLDWAGDFLEQRKANVVLCPELRARHDRLDRRWDRSRASMVRVIAATGRANIGICWDLGHDWENRLLEPDWTPIPDAAFLDLVRHVHVHDASPVGLLHQPLTFDGVPWRDQIRYLRERNDPAALTLEIRYRYALAAGEPWTVLAFCYRRVFEHIRPSPSLTT